MSSIHLFFGCQPMNTVPRKWSHAYEQHRSIIYFSLFVHLLTTLSSVVMWILALICEPLRCISNHGSFICIWWNVVTRQSWGQRTHESSWHLFFRGNQSWNLHSITVQFHYAGKLCVHINKSWRIDSNARNNSTSFRRHVGHPSSGSTCHAAILSAQL